MRRALADEDDEYTHQLWCQTQKRRSHGATDRDSPGPVDDNPRRQRQTTVIRDTPSNRTPTRPTARQGRTGKGGNGVHAGNYDCTSRYCLGSVRLIVKVGGLPRRRGDTKKKLPAVWRLRAFSCSGGFEVTKDRPLKSVF